MAQEIDAEILKLYAPFSEFKDPKVINDALKKGESMNISEGSILFKRDANDEYSSWLISGSLDLLDENFDVVNIDAADANYRHAIDNHSPHSVTAVCTSDSLIFKLKYSDLDVLRKASQRSGDFLVTSLTEANEIDSDWMSSMLSSPLFDFIPPSNIQELFKRFEAVSYEEGEIVLQQGEVGDYFYVIQKGSTKVEYNTGGKSLLLATLDKGAFFGEDALISNVPRNATITMITDGVLMRLSENDFTSLLHAPLIEKIDMQEVQKMIEDVDPLTWILDVRTQQEFQENMIENSINIPVLTLRKSLGKLDHEAVYVIRSGGDNRCELGAHILNGLGYTAYVLNESTD